jgi:uncharacterized protein (UPF0332 family)
VNEEAQTLVRYRLERAFETIEEARLLLAGGHTNTYVNRLYYACFYAVSALLLLHDKSFAKHSGLRSAFHREFVRPGMVSKELGHLYDRLFDNRQKADYADLVTFPPEDVSPWLDESVEFVRIIAELAENEMSLR